MPDKSATAPAYVATLTSYPIHHPVMRQVRLSGRQVDALKRPIPIALTSPSPLSPVEQANLQIQDAVARILQPRAVSAVLYQGKDAGVVSIWHDSGWLNIAHVQLGLPAQELAA